MEKKIVRGRERETARKGEMIMEKRVMKSVSDKGEQ